MIRGLTAALLLGLAFGIFEAMKNMLASIQLKECWKAAELIVFMKLIPLFNLGETAEMHAVYNGSAASITVTIEANLNGFLFSADPVCVFADNGRYPRIKKHKRVLAALPDTLNLPDVVVLTGTDPCADTRMRETNA